MLTPLQLELLKTFSRPIPEHQLVEIRQLLTDYFAQKIDQDMDQLFAENGWDASVAEQWATEHNRTPYRPD
ncbi:hypothetical protein [Spirosoma rhododendri]|uniref:Uncharacterized protein n=1 Tax=Spirosoma rhododendri TaxID=2728024 RepID=A0A7L5DIB5_9BACT|nr:hypothetical protein [Spirosoma rhododendri]QJD77785.1 hypothetical protein HH216_04615 [Spirosoma rhododendri]